MRDAVMATFQRRARGINSGKSHRRLRLNHPSRALRNESNLRSLSLVHKLRAIVGENIKTM